MGQSQSSAGDGSRGAAAAAIQAKTSYYELLSVERSATEDEIKKAYRKKALELHPDRNYGNVENATKLFAEIQSAYEVLSDPQERAWYDSHESAILQGQDPQDQGTVPTYQNVKITTANDINNIVGKFNRNVEFSDSPSGFFGFLRETFDHLAQEEDIAGQMEDIDNPEYPTFGHRDDDYPDVVKKFYAAWSGFATVKSYSWCDRWRLSDAPDRFIRRKMEQENAKCRKDGRDEFNEAVRTLVQFIKKRDPRVIVDTRTEEERSKALRDAADSQRRRAMEANAAKMSEAVPEWTKSREPDEHAELEGTFDSDTEEEEVFECVACNKIFKSEKQMDAHEKSKKHQKAIKDLQRRMRKQDASLNLNGSGATSGAATPDVDEDEEEVLDDLAAEVEDHQAQADIDDELSDGDIEEDELTKDDSVSDTDEDSPHDKNSGAPVSQFPAEDTSTPADSGDEDEDYAPRSTVEARIASTTLSDPSLPSTTPAASIPSDNDIDTTKDANDDDDWSSQPKKKLGAAAKKRAKKAAAATTPSTEKSDATTVGGSAEHQCSGCSAEFVSKTKLFEHLKANPKHAALKSVTSGSGGAKGKKKGRK
ncbi:Putative DnaJ domain, Zinc finger C2H2-type, Zinc finger C2H2 superfamily [Septoria linicola]|uniref:DnaJ domain, Zinc finger C2H2-type, Zinc finger C2H2 superfamily n=1 Tax=Septoria linicola TaxID=215465 RepID=A0A9Q9B886_9PEZI|nr:putative DnaJ domain, Zinc finger C2H2-type, Zinc finger C2H2 superfamily [Septoria linicola]USW59112.1 Putative DnaJ domain, Zinc finger C2H2-type, Zinc finger C2H2 superfamily [Septoria linicola]